MERTKPQPLPKRIGGYGGAQGLAEYLRAEKVTHVIDATHPFASQMSVNAINACRETGTQLCALTRPAWDSVDGDQWHRVQRLSGGRIPARLGKPMSCWRLDACIWPNLPVRPSINICCALWTNRNPAPAQGDRPVFARTV